MAGYQYVNRKRSTDNICLDNRAMSDSLASSRRTPNQYSPNTTNPPLSSNDFGFDRRSTISSLHTGGSNFVRCDGSVVFVQESVNVDTYNRLFQIADGQVLGEY